MNEQKVFGGVLNTCIAQYGQKMKDTRSDRLIIPARVRTMRMGALHPRMIFGLEKHVISIQLVETQRDVIYIYKIFQAFDYSFKNILSHLTKSYDTE